MERFLERVSVSEYKEKFILKGGMLASSLIGVNLRTTMDIDTSVKGLPLNEDDGKPREQPFHVLLSWQTIPLDKQLF